jgi:hypothetical protein
MAIMCASSLVLLSAVMVLISRRRDNNYNPLDQKKRMVQMIVQRFTVCGQFHFGANVGFCFRSVGAVVIQMIQTGSHC